MRALNQGHRGMNIQKGTNGTDVTCPAGVTTTVFTTTMVPPTYGGTWIIDGTYCLWVQFGAVMPSALTFTLSYNSINDSHDIPVAGLLATQLYPISGVLEITNGFPVPATAITFKVTPTGQNVVIKGPVTNSCSHCRYLIWSFSDGVSHA